SKNCRRRAQSPAGLMKRLLLGLGIIVALVPPAWGAEGLWMAEQIRGLAGSVRELGVKGDAHLFADLTGFPMGAAVSLGGCSASFVSPDGLIVTNNHCVQGALQFNSKPDRNLMLNGYLANARADELWAGPGSRVYVTVAVKDVTHEIMDKIDAAGSDLERY